MDFDKAWKKALSQTEIIRTRVKALMTYTTTKVPYVLLSESSVNIGDTVVRKGIINVQKPTLIIPPNNPQFLGFDFEDMEAFDQESLINFLLIRNVNFPSLKYDNQTNSLEIFEGKLYDAVKHFNQLLQQKEDVATGLIIGPEDCWQFSLLLFICTQISKNANMDIQKLLENFQKENDNHNS